MNIPVGSRPTAQATALCCFAAAFAYWSLGLTHFLQPREQLHFAQGVRETFFRSVAEDPAAFELHYWVAVIASLLGAAVVLGLSELLRERTGFALRVAALWGLIGYAVASVSYAQQAGSAIRVAERFAAFDPAAKAAAVAFGLAELDPTCFISFALCGIWILAVNIAGHRAGVFSRGLASMGIAGGLMYLLVFLGSVLHIPLLIDSAAAMGAVLIGPTWFVWTGVVLRRLPG